jgi:hypothetical protein
VDERTPKQTLADELLGEPVEEWVLRHRGSVPPHLSWRVIAEKLRTATNGKVWVTDQTLRNWTTAEREPAA